MAPLHRAAASQANNVNHLHIQHFTHHHPLQKLFMALEFNCDGCSTRGYGVRYRCATCDFDLHEQCAQAPLSLPSHLHPQHQLILLNRPGNSHFCNICGGTTDGLLYACQGCDFDVHPLCTQTAVMAGVPSMTMGQVQPAGTVFSPQVAAPAPMMNNYQQPVMINQQGQQQGVYGNGVNNNGSNKYSKAAKVAAGLLVTSLTGIPMNFSSKK